MSHPIFHFPAHSFLPMQAASSLWTVLQRLSRSCLSASPGVWLCMQPLKLNQTGTFVLRWWKVSSFDSCCYCVQWIKVVTLRQIRHFSQWLCNSAQLPFLHKHHLSAQTTKHHLIPIPQFINLQLIHSAHKHATGLKRRKGQPEPEPEPIVGREGWSSLLGTMMCCWWHCTLTTHLATAAWAILHVYLVHEKLLHLGSWRLL